jgi:hypothetical protein
VSNRGSTVYTTGNVDAPLVIAAGLWTLIWGVPGLLLRLLHRAPRRRRVVAEALLERVRAAADLFAKQRIVREFWDAEPQRVLLLLGAVLANVKSQNRASEPAWHLTVDLLEQATKRDETALSGLTPGAEAAIRTASATLSHAMGEAIRSGTLDQDTTEMFIEGGKGSHAAAQAVCAARAWGRK